MKRLLAILGVFALLGTLFVVATASPSAADTAGWTAKNDGTTGTILVTAKPAVGDTVTWKVGPSSTVGKKLQTGVKYTITASDADTKCLVNGGSVETIYDKGAWDPYEMWTWSVDTGNCVGTMTIETEKRTDHPLDSHAVELSSYVMAIAANTAGLGTENSTPQSAQCLPEPIVITQNGGPDNDVTTTVPSSVIYKGKVELCHYLVIEGLAPEGQTCVDVTGQLGPAVFPPTLPQGECAGATNGAIKTEVITFWNDLDHVPMTVTKTFTGREYYTTVDRGDFHIYTPGLCGALPIDPFGGLIGNVGIYRTINASQSPQVVAWLPDILKAGGHGPCTYRVQENNAPDGCTAVAPDGSDADGPYWDQTWAPGMTAMTFNIVNDCAEVPEPTPEPTVAPTTAPKKPGAPGAKKPSGGGSAAPKFTG